MAFWVGFKPIGALCPYSALNYIMKKGVWGADHKEDAADASFPAAREDFACQGCPPSVGWSALLPWRPQLVVQPELVGGIVLSRT